MPLPAFSEQYTTVAFVGEGGWAEVYQARHAMLQRQVAIKVMHAHLVRREDNVKRFIKEAQVLSRLDSPNVAKVYEAGFLSDGRPYLSMEFLEGHTLADYLDAQPEHKLSESEAASIFRQATAALLAAEKHRVVHRDIKPSNIFISKTPSGEVHVKLLDFGLARIFDEDKPSSLTASGETVGTPMYMSPEQCRGGRLDARSDIYSLACVIYECLAGQRPFDGGNFFEVMQAHVGEIPATLSDAGIKVSRGLESIIMRCLEKEPEDRFSSASHLLEALEKPLPARWIGKRARKNIARYAAILAPLVVLSAAAIYFAPKVVAPKVTPKEQWTTEMRGALRAMRLGDYATARRNMNSVRRIADSGMPVEDRRLSLSYDELLAHLEGDYKREESCAREFAKTGGEPFSHGYKAAQPAVANPDELIDLLEKSARTKTAAAAIASQINSDCLGRGPIASQPQLQRVLPLYQRIFGTHSKPYADAEFILGLGFEQQVNNPPQTFMPEALSAFNAALTSYESATPKDAKRIARSHEHIAITLGRMNDISGATRHLRIAKQIEDEQVTDDIDRANISRLLCLALRMENKHDELKEIATSELDKLLKTSTYANQWEPLLYYIDSCYANGKLEEAKRFLQSNNTKDVPYFRGICLLGLAHCALLENRLDDAQRFMGDACDELELGTLMQDRMVSGYAFPQLLGVSIVRKDKQQAVAAGRELVAMVELKGEQRPWIFPFTANYLLANAYLRFDEPDKAKPHIDQLHDMLIRGFIPGLGADISPYFDVTADKIFSRDMTNMVDVARRYYGGAYPDRLGLFRTKSLLTMADYLQLLRVANTDKTTALSVAKELKDLLERTPNMETFKRCYCYLQLAKTAEWSGDSKAAADFYKIANTVPPVPVDRSFPDGPTP